MKLHPLVCWVPVLASSAVPAAPPFFLGLGDFPDGESYSVATGVNADGSVVVGFGHSPSGIEAFRWTSATGLVALGDLPGGNIHSAAAAVNADGTVVVGRSESAAGPEAFRWTAASGMIGLGHLPGASFSEAYGVSADGATVVGMSMPGGTTWQAFRWTSAAGMTGLGTLPGGEAASYAFGASADGALIVGYSSSAIGPGGEAFTWTASGGLAGMGIASRALAVTAGGDVVVGSMLVGGAIYQAFRWSAPTGFVPLGALSPGGYTSWAHDASDDGTAIVGQSNSDSGWHAFVWTPAQGMVSLRDRLVAIGVTGLEGWSLDEATAISADGRTIVGHGINPLGWDEAWIAFLGDPCYPDCTADGTLTVADFGCFQTRFVAADPYADCNADGQHTVADFGCFQTKFVAGCP